jgi:DUF4097 and DUF4098 domain-containing protein YvlB
MLTTLATLAAVAIAAPQQDDRRSAGQTDTTVAVQRNARLEVNNYGGEIIVRTWNQSSVRVRASHSSRSRVEVSTSASAVLVKTAGRRGPPSIVDLELTVPTWMAMSLGGVYTDVRVENAGGAVSAESVQGDIQITGGTGNVRVKAVEGNVSLARTRGRIEVNAVEGDVTLTDGGGDVMIETVDGDIYLVRVDATNLEVNTVDGDIVYEGAVKSGGTYRLGTHDGDITVVVPPNANLSGWFSSFDGEFDASFAVDTVRTGRHRWRFTIGRGGAAGATLELETFDGDIRLRRPGEVTIDPPRHSKDNDHDDDY